MEGAFQRDWKSMKSPLASAPGQNRQGRDEGSVFPLVDQHRDWLNSLGDVVLKWGEPLSRHTTFKVGGSAACLAIPENLQTLQVLMHEFSQRKIPWVILGGGSNVLPPDDPWDVVVIQLKRACGALHILHGPLAERGAEQEKILVQVGAGVPLSAFLRFCVHRELGGAEFLAGIPGTMGGALTMNAGAFGGSISDILYRLEIMDSRGHTRRLLRKDLSCSYRSMGLPSGQIILEAVLEMRPKGAQHIKEELKKKISRRRKTQPFGVPSAGCVFKNPAGHAAGALIEKAGLKGAGVGGARVSEKHANYILNVGSATAGDILQLMERMENAVMQHFGIRLEREVRVWCASPGPGKDVSL